MNVDAATLRPTAKCEKNADTPRAHVLRMLKPMKANEPLHPLDMVVLRMEQVVLEPESFLGTIDQLGAGGAAEFMASPGWAATDPSAEIWGADHGRPATHRRKTWGRTRTCAALPRSENAIGVKITPPRPRNHLESLMTVYQLDEVFNEAQIPTLTYVPPAEAKQLRASLKTKEGLQKPRTSPLARPRYGGDHLSHEAI